MSRHQFDYQRYTITMGWDRPLNTFFATVLYFDEPLILLGTQVGEYPQVHHFIEVLKQHLKDNHITDAVLPTRVVQMLEQDKKTEGEGFGERPTEIQQFILSNRKP